MKTVLHNSLIRASIVCAALSSCVGSSIFAGDQSIEMKPQQLQIDVSKISPTEWEQSGLEGKTTSMYLEVDSHGIPSKIYLEEVIIDSIIADQLVKAVSAVRFDLVDSDADTGARIVEFQLKLHYPLENRGSFSSWVDRSERKWERKFERMRVRSLNLDRRNWD